jgi:hypothetical protein
MSWAVPGWNTGNRSCCSAPQFVGRWRTSWNENNAWYIGERLGSRGTRSARTSCSNGTSG